ncbi:MAG: hypothetical protein RR182_09215 [Alistipes sp.]
MRLQGAETGQVKDAGQGQAPLRDAQGLAQGRGGAYPTNRRIIPPIRHCEPVLTLARQSVPRPSLDLANVSAPLGRKPLTCLRIAPT